MDTGPVIPQIFKCRMVTMYKPAINLKKLAQNKLTEHAAYSFRYVDRLTLYLVSNLLHGKVQLCIPIYTHTVCVCVYKFVSVCSRSACVYLDRIQSGPVLVCVCCLTPNECVAQLISRAAGLLGYTGGRAEPQSQQGTASTRLGAHQLVLIRDFLN